jgi:hypothetical protein
MQLVLLYIKPKPAKDVGSLTNQKVYKQALEALRVGGCTSCCCEWNCKVESSRALTTPSDTQLDNAQ